MKYEVGDKFLCLNDGQVYVVERIVTKETIITSYMKGDQLFHLPFYIEEIVPWTPLLEELL